MLLREVPEHRRELLFARLVFGIEERLDGFGERILPRGSVVLLAGLAALFVNLGGDTFDMVKMQEAVASAGISAETQSWIFLTLLIGFGILISLFQILSMAKEPH